MSHPWIYPARWPIAFTNSLASDSCFFFFFSSRRRHTRFDCDWSSDVCSSDLRRRGCRRASRPFPLPASPAVHRHIEPTPLGDFRTTQDLTVQEPRDDHPQDRKSTRLNSSHSQISYAVFCLKKKKHIKDMYIRDSQQL